MKHLSPQLFKAADETYEGTRAHAEAIDKFLGIDVEGIEKQLLDLAQAKNPSGSHKNWGQGIHGGNQTWVGLSHQTLQTPYHELVELCEILNPSPDSSVIDLGAGYGRLGLVLTAFYPQVHFLGFEFVSERVIEGSRIFLEYGCQRASLVEQDLTSDEFTLPSAEYYFLYDYGTLMHIRKTLKQLEKIALKKNFKVIARGKGSRSLIQYEHPWLSEVYPVIHREHYSIFSMSKEL